ncbi:MAG TPA: hypothetical protein VJH92_02910 [Candidatus Nanoarchaeia archaeon]|nr:hypothetical protein [Candidatus Nanoarchaeia archaeon]
MVKIDWKAYEDVDREEKNKLINDLLNRGYHLLNGEYVARLPSSGEYVSSTEIERGLEKLTFGDSYQIQLINASKLLALCGYKS